MSAIDTERAFVFPNNIRYYRKKTVGPLLQLSQRIPSITYVRLSKIERGEIFARANEIQQIADALHVAPEALLVDIDDPAFDIKIWAAEFQDQAHVDDVTDMYTVFLAAAMRKRRASDPALTITALESEHGIAPVILSRIENAYKPFSRWNKDIQKSLLNLFDVNDTDELFSYLSRIFSEGLLDAVLPLIANPETRKAKTRAKVQEIRHDLAHSDVSKTIIPLPCESHETQCSAPSSSSKPSNAIDNTGLATEIPACDAVYPDDTVLVRLISVYGSPLEDGLVALTATGQQIEAPRIAGPHSYGLRIFRPTLGAGMPGRSVLVIDPDCFPSPGGLAVLREPDGLRLLSITIDRQGRMLGYSENPDREILIDEVPPHDISAVLCAYFE